MPLPLTEPGDMEIISAPIDFLGVNCYSVIPGFNRSKAGRSGEAERKHIPKHIPTWAGKYIPQAIYDAVMTVETRFQWRSTVVSDRKRGCFHDDPALAADGNVATIRSAIDVLLSARTLA